MSKSQTNSDRSMLGGLRWNSSLGQWEGAVEAFTSGAIRFAMVDEDGWANTNLETLLKIGNEFLIWASKFEPQCRDRIAHDLLSVYNESWADDDPNEGPPQLTRDEFLAALRLDSISLDEGGSSLFQYSCGDLFAGHGIELMLNADRSAVGRASLFG